MSMVNATGGGWALRGDACIGLGGAVPRSGLAYRASAPPRRSGRVCSPRGPAALVPGPFIRRPRAGDAAKGRPRRAVRSGARDVPFDHASRNRAAVVVAQPSGTVLRVAIVSRSAATFVPQGSAVRSRLTASSSVMWIRPRVTRRSSRRTNRDRFSVVRRGGC